MRDVTRAMGEQQAEGDERHGYGGGGSQWQADLVVSSSELKV